MPLTSREGKGAPRKGRPPSTPWGKMMRHRAVWAIILNNFTFHYAFYVVMIWLPTYFDKVSVISCFRVRATKSAICCMRNRGIQD